MRAESTRAENMLWQSLRGKKLQGLKFKRQVPFDGFIVDFVCFSQKLIIEVDGAQHAESENDKVRDGHFLARGFRTLRFWNNEVEANLDDVCQHILAIIVGKV